MEYRRPYISISREDFCKSLCDLLDFREEAIRQFSEKTGDCRKWRCYCETLTKELDKKAVVKPWEIRLAKALRGFEKNKVFEVELDFEEGYAMSEMECKDLLHMLHENVPCYLHYRHFRDIWFTMDDVVRIQVPGYPFLVYERKPDE